MIAQIPSMPSSAMYRGNDLTWQVHCEDRLQSLISTANRMYLKCDNLLATQP